MSEAPLSVTELTAQIKQILEQGFAHVRVTGEVSRLTRPSSGHLYFTIKDQHAAISAVVWRSTAGRLSSQPEEGGEFVFSGHLSVYEPRGSYQLVVTRIEAAGAGQLAAEFERRKQQFAERGWFDGASKKSLPAIPGHIGIITSATAAAFEDVKKVLASRPGWLQLTHAPCLVQGNQAPESIATAISELAGISAPPDVILLVRGGGSIEDLWCFNDEKVVEAIVHCPIPIITGIGHEIDTTLADLAADLRAATPSNAVEVACPARDELLERLPRMQALARLMQQHLIRYRRDLGSWLQRCQHSWERQSDARHHASTHLLALIQHHGRDSLRVDRQHLRELEKRLAPLEPGLRLRQQRQQLHRLQEKLSADTATLVIRPEHHLLHASQRLHRLQGHILAQKQQAGLNAMHELSIQATSELNQSRQSLALLNRQLHALGPRQVLKRGYSLSFDSDGGLVTQVSQLKSGDAMRVHFQDGEATTKVESVAVSKS